MEGQLYWIIEYGKVLLGFGFLMFLWPTVVFRNYLAGKGATFRFSFCVTVQIVIVNTAVLFLGLIKLLNVWSMCLLFYGTLLFSLREYLILTKEKRKKFRYLVNGTFGWKNFFLLERRKLLRTLELFCKRIGSFYKKNWLEYTLLMIVVVYGMIYFTIGVFQEHSYGFSDMYVHHSWTYQLSQGVPFSAGIYPEGMHCVIYALSALFGIRLYNCMLFVQSAVVGVTLIAIHCLLKELFRWRYSAIFTLTLMLTFGNLGRYILISMARMQCALPQEFAFPAVFLCCLYLVKYLKGGRKAVYKGKETKGFWDENLLVFLLAFASTIVIHFYATFMAFFLCMGVAMFLWKRIFTKERFLPLVASVLLGLVISVVPMVAGFATGIPLQGSLYWAMGVMQQSVQQEVPEEQKEPETIVPEDVAPDTVPPEESVVPEENIAAPAIGKTETVWGKVCSVGNNILNKCKSFGKTMYENAYLEMYEAGFVNGILLSMLLVLLGGSLGAFLIFCVEKKKNMEIEHPSYGGYFIIVYISLIYVLVYASKYLGLPVLMERYRIAFICNLMVMAVATIPMDILFSLGTKALEEKGLKIFSAAFAGGIVAVVWLSGAYHGYLYFELTRYDATVQVTNQIIEELPEKSYTIVSPTEELYQVIEFGWHEELFDFVKGLEQDEYSLPSEYVFVFVEKKPFRYAQYHFHSGPHWLGYNKYQEIYGYTSTWPEYTASEISKEYAEHDLYSFSETNTFYLVLEPRTVLQSKLYHWCEEFKKQYPNEFKTYYEDEYFVCYYWKQNPYKVFNLVIE